MENKFSRRELIEGLRRSPEPEDDLMPGIFSGVVTSVGDRVVIRPDRPPQVRPGQRVTVIVLMEE